MILIIKSSSKFFNTGYNQSYIRWDKERKESIQSSEPWQGVQWVWDKLKIP